MLIVVEGVPGRLVARHKNNVAGLWLNTSSATFDLVPSYYAMSSTRPLEEITTEEFRNLHGLGFHQLRFTPAVGQAQALSTEDLKAFREAIIRLKQKQGLYVKDEYGVAFIGRSLFRASIELPANVTVGAVRDARLSLPRGKAAQQVHGAPEPGARGHRAAPARLRLRLSHALRADDGGDRDCRRAAGLRRVPPSGALSARASANRRRR